MIMILSLGLLSVGAFAKTTPDTLSKASQKCTTCHKKTSLGIVEMWGASKHFRAKVGCYECHKAEATDKDQFMHHGKRISTIVSPKDCSKCHAKEVKEFKASITSKFDIDTTKGKETEAGTELSPAKKALNKLKNK